MVPLALRRFDTGYMPVGRGAGAHQYRFADEDPLAQMREDIYCRPCFKDSSTRGGPSKQADENPTFKLRSYKTATPPLPSLLLVLERRSYLRNHTYSFAVSMK